MCLLDDLHAHSNVNATAILDHALPHTTATYWTEFEQVSQHNVSLNYFEKLWAAWYAYMGNDVLATGIMSFVMHELVYFGRSLPWLLIDNMTYFNKYKIQNVCALQRALGLTSIDCQTAQDSDSTRTVAVRQTCPDQPLLC